ncbi:MAG: hypothetical protein JWO58_1596 [Chitinophagaceae bacterium]|nr:hypothetical protein [Chitinophagaceae bacterium]
MKKIMLYSMLLFAIAGSSGAQTKEEKTLKEPRTHQKKIKKEHVPKEVTDEFLLIYPNEPLVQWYAYPYYWDFEIGELAVDSSGYIIEYEFPEFYEVEILKENKKHRSLFSRAGKLIHTRTTVSKEELPKIIQDAFNSGPYKDWNVVEERELIQFTEPSIRVYSIRVKKGKQKHVLYYAEKNGQLIQVKKIKN